MALLLDIETETGGTMVLDPRRSTVAKVEFDPIESRLAETAPGDVDDIVAGLLAALLNGPCSSRIGVTADGPDQ